MIKRNFPAWAGAGLLFLAVILVYQPVWYAGFVWDDDVYLKDNPSIAGPLGLKEIWTSSVGSVCPLTLTGFWIIHEIGRLDPLPYHLVNVLLHGACGIALWRVLKSLHVPGAGLGAMLWTLHPVQVESVAWISEMKNTLSGLFFLLSILYFVKFIQLDDSAATRRYYGATLLFAVLSLVSKSATVILPVVLCLCAWWLDGKWQWRRLITLFPVFLLSVAASVWTVLIFRAGQNQDPLLARSWPVRIIDAGDAVWIYLGKLLWPHPVMVIYPSWTTDPSQWTAYVPGMILIVGLVIFWLKRHSWGRSWLFAAACFLAALFPALGLVNQSFLHYSLVADHLQYLASMAPLALAGAGLTLLGKVLIPERISLKTGLATALLLTLGFLSWKQSWAYENSETLWSDELAKNPTAWAAYNNLGSWYVLKGQLDKAMDAYRKALALNPRDAETHCGIALVYLHEGKMQEAIAESLATLAIDPRQAKAHNNLGYAYLKTGQIDQARDHFQRALEINPYDAEARNNIADALLQQGRADDAIAQYETSLALDPSNVAVRNNLGTVFLRSKQVDEAMDQFQKVLEIDPHNVDAHYNLGVAYSQKGDSDAAIIQYQTALQMAPDRPDVHNSLGVVLLKRGHIADAVAQFEQALQLKPDYTNAHKNLGWVLLRMGKTDEAIAQFQEVLRLDPQDSFAQANLAKAMALKQQSPTAK